MLSTPCRRSIVRAARRSGSMRHTVPPRRCRSATPRPRRPPARRPTPPARGTRGDRRPVSGSSRTTRPRRSWTQTCPSPAAIAHAWSERSRGQPPGGSVERGAPSRGRPIVHTAPLPTAIRSPGGGAHVAFGGSGSVVVARATPDSRIELRDAGRAGVVVGRSGRARWSAPPARPTAPSASAARSTGGRAGERPHRLVSRSTRETVRSSALSAHTAPAPTVTLVGVPPTAACSTTGWWRGRSRPAGRPRRRRQRRSGSVSVRPATSAAAAGARRAAAPRRRPAATGDARALSGEGARGGGGSGWAPAERGVLFEHGPLEAAQRRAGLDPELRDQLPASVAVGGERVGLAARAVQREHLLAAQPFAQRMLRRPARRARRALGVPAAGEVGLDPVLERRRAGAPPGAPPARRQPARTRDRRAPGRATAPAPRAAAAAARSGIPRGERGAAARHQLVEARRRRARRRRRAARSRAVRDELPVAERLAQAGDEVVQAAAQRSPGEPPPQRVDQPVAGERLFGVQEQDREQEALPALGQRHRREPSRTSSGPRMLYRIFPPPRP